MGREIGDPTETALALMRLSMVLHAEGDLRGAEARCREALPVLRERGTRALVADTLFHLGEIQKAQGDLVAARKHHEEAQAIRTDLQAAFAIAKSRVALASLAIEEGHPEAAEALLGPALEVFIAQKATDWEASAQAVLARSLLGGKRNENARRALERALALSNRSQSPHVRLMVAATASRVEAADGRADDGMLRLDAALAEAVRLGLVSRQFELRLARGEIGIGSGQTTVTNELLALAADARAHGFGLVARKAEDILRRQTGKRGTS
jgi:tetratricopeptide (TPR) repeat protein